MRLPSSNPRDRANPLPNSKPVRGGRDPRMASHRKSSRSKKGNPEASWNKAEEKRGVGKVMIGLMCAIALLLVSVLGYFLSQNQDLEDSSGEVDHSVGGFLVEASAEEVSRSTKLAVEGFLNAETLIERCQFIHGGEKHLEKMQKFYARPGETDEACGFSKMASEKLGAVEGVPCIYLNALDASGEKHGFNLFSASDRLLIDWDSSVCYGEMTWDEFQEKKPEEPILMRVMVGEKHSRDNDGAPLDYVLLSERDDRSQRTVYVNPDSEVSSELKETFKKGASSYPYTLYLQWNMEQRMTEIVKLRHLYWMDPSFYEE